jgi:thiol-disulfide isomerase/thioredoxin
MDLIAVLKTHWMWLLAIVVVLALVYSYMKYVKTEHFSDGANKLAVYYFFSPNCGFCREFNQPWSYYSAAVDSDDNLKEHVKLYKVDIDSVATSTLKDDPLVQKHSATIKGVPFVLFVKEDGTETEFTMERTEDNLMKMTREQLV